MGTHTKVSITVNRRGSIFNFSSPVRRHARPAFGSRIEGPPGLHRLLWPMGCCSHLPDPRRSRQFTLVLVADRQRSDDTRGPRGAVGGSQGAFKSVGTPGRRGRSWKRCLKLGRYRAVRICYAMRVMTSKFIPPLRPASRGAFLCGAHRPSLAPAPSAGPHPPPCKGS